MEPAGLLSLPVEILHKVSEYLTVTEVLNCSETCHYLRTAFNDNKVWRKFVPEKALPLESLEQILEPAFRWEDSLSPLCVYRLHYMRLSHLMNNWNTATFAKYTSKTLHSYASGVFNVPKGRGQLIYKDKYLFLGRFMNDIESDGIEVWDVGKEPVVHSFLGIRNINYDHFYIIGSNLAVVECKKVSVYQINLPERQFPFLYSFIITETGAMWNDEDGHRERCDFRCVGWSNCNIGQYLVSNKCGDEGEGSIIHVWDILNASKVGAFALPVEGFSVNVVSNEGDELLLKQGIQGSHHSNYFLFNIKEKTFSEAGCKIEGRLKQMILYKSHILAFTDANSQTSEGFNDNVCILYDLKSSTEVKKRRFENHYKKNLFLTSSAIVHGSFILFCFDHFQKINALTLETMEHFQCGFEIRFASYQFNVFSSTFVVAESKDGRLYLCNFTEKEMLIRPLEEILMGRLNQYNAMTKLVILDSYQINVFHFW